MSNPFILTIKFSKLEGFGVDKLKDSNIKIVDYDPVYAAQIVEMWRTSKEKAIGQKEVHSFENHVDFLMNTLVKDNKIYIAIDMDNNEVVGILASNEKEVNQLYIHIDYQGRGIGKKLLDIAKSNSMGRLTLYTFEINKKAQSFYENNGFRIIGRGYENEENLEDILYEWVDSN